MDFSHFNSHLPLINPDENVVKSGIEYELGKYINDIRVERDSLVKGVVRRYSGYFNNESSCTLFTEYEEDGYIFLDCIEVDTYKNNHAFFGYKLHPTEDLESISYNSPLKNGTVLAKADSLGKSGSYKYGLNASVVLMSHPSVSEDGYVVSESFAKRAKFHSITKRVINVSKSDILINLYGDDSVFKFIPDIGENVREDGLLCATRKRNDFFSISDLTAANIKEVDHIFDNLLYVNTNSKVLDIKVVKGNYSKKVDLDANNEVTKQLDFYAEMLNNYYRSIVNTYEEIMKEKKAIYGENGRIRLTPRLHRLLTDAHIKGNIIPKGGFKVCYRKRPIEQYWIEVTTISEITPNYGFKLTDKHAAKGVICRILPDECMPIDELGNRADVISDSTSTISRMNLGRSYEIYLGAVSRDCRHHLINTFMDKYGANYLQSLNKDDYVYIKEYLHGLYSLINPEMSEFISGLNDKDLVDHCREVLTDNLYIYYPTDNETNIVQVIENIEASIYKPHNGKVTYTDELGRKVTTKENIRIGQSYFMFLEKIANDYSAVSSGFVNSFGFPIKATGIDKNKYPHSLTPTKTMGETEVRIFTSFMHPEAIADMLDMSLNPLTHKSVVKEILGSPVAFDNKFNIDRDKIPYGQTKSLMLFRHITNSFGFDYEYIKQDNFHPPIVSG
jgi:DNA-directed RNA polymerase beta subunit